MMNQGRSYILPDRALALLVVLSSLHKLGYKEISKSLIAQVVKNISLRKLYPERRELPESDPYKKINPWFDGIFKEDIPELIKGGFVKKRSLADLKSRKTDFICVTEHGKALTDYLLNLIQYSGLEQEVKQLIIENKLKHGRFSTPQFIRSLKHKGKTLYKEEVKIFDRVEDDSEFPICASFDITDPRKITAYIDAKKWIHSAGKMFKEKIKRKQFLRAYHNESQLQFLERCCKEYAGCPVTEWPLIEVCGLCTKVEVVRNRSTYTILTLFIEGQGITIIVPTSLSRNLEFHSLRVIGKVYKDHGRTIIDAFQVYDRGVSYPVNGRIYS